MQVQNPNHSLSKVLHQRYQTHLDNIDTSPIIDPLFKQPISIPKDHFSPSKDYQKIQKLKDHFHGALKDKPAFLALADQLKRHELIDGQEKIAMDFLANKSKKIDFESFIELGKNEKLHHQMRQNIDHIVQKLQMMNFLHGGIML